jgi:hypothetical protein
LSSFIKPTAACERRAPRRDTKYKERGIFIWRMRTSARSLRSTSQRTTHARDDGHAHAHLHAALDAFDRANSQVAIPYHYLAESSSFKSKEARDKVRSKENLREEASTNDE